MSEFLAALAGAVVGGMIAVFGGFKLDQHQRIKVRENLRAAIAVEIASLVELVKRQEYAKHLRAFARYILTAPQEHRTVFRLPIKQSYFTVYETNAASIGELISAETVEIICFYQQARSILDSVVDNDSVDPWVTNEDLAGYYNQIAAYVDNLCGFGSELVGKLTNADMTQSINDAAQRLMHGTNESNGR